MSSQMGSRLNPDAEEYSPSIQVPPAPRPGSSVPRPPWTPTPKSPKTARQGKGQAWADIAAQAPMQSTAEEFTPSGTGKGPAKPSTPSAKPELVEEVIRAWPDGTPRRVAPDPKTPAISMIPKGVVDKQKVGSSSVREPPSAQEPVDANPARLGNTTPQSVSNTPQRGEKGMSGASIVSQSPKHEHSGLTEANARAVIRSGAMARSRTCNFLAASTIWSSLVCTSGTDIIYPQWIEPVVNGVSNMAEESMAVLGIDGPGASMTLDSIKPRKAKVCSYWEKNIKIEAVREKVAESSKPPRTAQVPDPVVLRVDYGQKPTAGQVEGMKISSEDWVKLLSDGGGLDMRVILGLHKYNRSQGQRVNPMFMLRRDPNSSFQQRPHAQKEDIRDFARMSGDQMRQMALQHKQDAKVNQGRVNRAMGIAPPKWKWNNEDEHMTDADLGLGSAYKERSQRTRRIGTQGGISGEALDLEREFRSLLNKLTDSNFTKTCDACVEVFNKGQNYANFVRLTKMLYSKAVDESEMLGDIVPDFCEVLLRMSPVFLDAPAIEALRELEREFKEIQNKRDSERVRRYKMTIYNGAMSVYAVFIDEAQQGMMQLDSVARLSAKELELPESDRTDFLTVRTSFYRSNMRLLGDLWIRKLLPWKVVTSALTYLLNETEYNRILSNGEQSSAEDNLRFTSAMGLMKIIGFSVHRKKKILPEFDLYNDFLLRAENVVKRGGLAPYSRASWDELVDLKSKDWLRVVVSADSQPSQPTPQYRRNQKTQKMETVGLLIRSDSRRTFMEKKEQQQRGPDLVRQTLQRSKDNAIRSI